jgi:2-dehydropantoate 2-reductase
VKIAILGAGAMGSVFGGHLSLAGHDVTLVDSWREHMEAVRSDGLVLERPGDSPLVARPAAIADPAELAPVDAVIVLTKGYATQEAAASIAHAVGPGTWVATVQNGLGNDRVLADVFGPDRVVPGTTTVGAEVIGPGRVKMSAMTADGTAVTQLGSPRTADGLPDGVSDLAQVLTDAGLPTKAIADPDVVIWTKLSMAACIGPLTAAVRLTIGDVWQNDAGRALVRDMFEEVVAVAHAEGVGIDKAEVWDHLNFTLDNVGDHYSSMAVDVMAGRRTEVGTFCLEVARRGQAHGLPVPRCLTVGQLVQVVEAAAAAQHHHEGRETANA